MENSQKGANIGGGYEKVEGVKEKWKDEKEERKKRKNNKQNEERSKEEEEERK